MSNVIIDCSNHEDWSIDLLSQMSGYEPDKISLLIVTGVIKGDLEGPVAPYGRIEPQEALNFVRTFGLSRHDTFLRQFNYMEEPQYLMPAWGMLVEDFARLLKVQCRDLWTVVRNGLLETVHTDWLFKPCDYLPSGVIENLVGYNLDLTEEEEEEEEEDDDEYFNLDVYFDYWLEKHPEAYVRVRNIVSYLLRQVK